MKHFFIKSTAFLACVWASFLLCSCSQEAPMTDTSLGVHSSINDKGGLDTYDISQLTNLNGDMLPAHEEKGSAIKTICYVEVNDNNILNAGEFTMKKSGKPFVDIVQIFAANINYDHETDRVYVHLNPNVQELLEKADRYIKPLQDKGIKVCLSILGNHDKSGVANLGPERARAFAAELKRLVDTYHLDGVDFDDEYSKYGEPGDGFTQPSAESAARLVYETRKAMPDKIITWYQIGHSPSGTVDNTPVGEMIDYAYYAYYGSWNDGSSKIQGLVKAKYGPYPLDIKGGVVASDNNLRRLRTEGYGVNLMYNLCVVKKDTVRIQNYTQGFSKLARALYDDEVVWSNVFYNHNDPTPHKI
ncbi:glycosyl hydrolase family 18 protein [Porphyromonas pogonae]|uniref:glycosyl hydrolase family 18 protein n=1 Tax=Porphyromonas pogonae TaxID=867595 RepID=UPI002E7609AB|nr:glycosyl hydrolase family 18 protein [Porphyromonas pogonae]